MATERARVVEDTTAAELRQISAKLDDLTLLRDEVLAVLASSEPPRRSTRLPAVVSEPDDLGDALRRRAGGRRA